MKNNLKRILAAGLLASMMVSLSACEQGIGKPNDDAQDTSAGAYDTAENGTGNNVQPPNKVKTELKGAVWEAVKTQNAVQLPHESWSTLPVQFLEDEGIITYDANGKLHILNTESIIIR